MLITTGRAGPPVQITAMSARAGIGQAGVPGSSAEPMSSTDRRDRAGEVRSSGPRLRSLNSVGFNVGFGEDGDWLLTVSAGLAPGPSRESECVAKRHVLDEAFSHQSQSGRLDRVPGQVGREFLGQVVQRDSVQLLVSAQRPEYCQSAGHGHLPMRHGSKPLGCTPNEAA
jgi:hypothetical protein